MTSTTTEITNNSNHKRTGSRGNNNNITAAEVVVPTINRRKLKSLDSSGAGDDDNSNNDARGRMGQRMGGLSRNDSSGSKKKGVRGMLVKSFSFSLKKSKRSLTPMRRTASDGMNGDDDQGSVSSTEQESSRPMDTTTIKRVRFSKKNTKKSNKVNKEIITFSKTTEQEAPNYWYSDVDMLDMMEDVKHTVKQYLRKCERYCLAMEKIASKCHQADVSRDSITDMLDPKVLLQIADAAARGVEHHVSPRTVDTRNEVVEMVLDIQDFYNTNSKDGGGKSSYKKNLTSSTNQRQQQDEKAQAIAKKYNELSKTSRLIAKTMGDGDALVANQILKRTPSTTTTTTTTTTTAVV